MDAADQLARRSLERIERWLDLSPDDIRARYLGASMLLFLGETDRAHTWMQQAVDQDPEDPCVIMNSACFWVVIGNAEQALDPLEKGVRFGIANRRWLTHDPDMDPLRDHPRFQALMERMP